MEWAEKKFKKKESSEDDVDIHKKIHFLLIHLMNMSVSLIIQSTSVKMRLMKLLVLELNQKNWIKTQHCTLSVMVKREPRKLE